MKKALILYSGQGSQFDGLGRDFYDRYPPFKKIIQEATKVTGIEVLQVLERCQTASTKELQVALTAYSVGVFECLKKEAVVNFKGALGLSLGEYPALITSGALSLTDGLKLVQKRAQLMQQEVGKHQGALMAVFTSDLLELKELLEKYNKPIKRIWIANYNAPKQVVLGGEKESLLELRQELKGRRKRALLLNVAGAFHTPFFTQTSKALTEVMATVEFHDLAFPVFSNTTGEAFTKDELPVTLAKQVMQPTYFEKCLQKMITQEKPDILLEIGPGNALSKFARQLKNTPASQRLDTVQAYQQTLAELRG